MANRILIKRSSSTGVAPSTSAISLGELAINTYDGRLFAKKDDGSASVIDLTRNDPIRVLGDASSTYAYDQSTYTSNVTITLADTAVSAGTYGNVDNGVVNVPSFTVDSKGRVTGVTTQSFSAAANLGTIATQDSDDVTITGGNIDATAIGTTTASTGKFTNVTVTGTLNSNDLTSANITLTGDATIGGSATINGDLTVLGTTTTVNSTAVSIADVNITLAKDAADAAQADGAGLTVAGADATLTYVSTGDKWSFNKAVFAPSLDIGSGDFTVDASGNIVSTGDFSAVDGSFSGTLGATGATTLGSTLDVTGATTLSSTLDAGASTLASVSVTGAATVGGTLGVTGASTLASVGVTNNATVGGTLGVTGASTLASVGVTNNATVGGTLGVTGASTLGTLTAGNTSVASLSASGTVSFSDLTAGKMVFVDDAGHLATDADLSYDNTSNTLTLENLTINGTTSLAGISTTAVSATQIVYGGAGGAFTGEADFTYNDTTNTLSTGSISLTDDATVGGTLTVTGAGTVGSTLGVTGNLAVNTNKFTVNATNGNTGIAGDATVAGTLGVTGASTLGGTLAVTGNVAVNTNKFTVTASNGNTGIAGTLAVTGGTVLSNTLDVTGAAEFAAAVNLTANVGATLGNYSTGSLKVLGDASVNGVLQVSGAIYKAGYEVINTTDTIDGGTF